MRLTLITLTCLCLVVSASLVVAKEKKQEKQMDPQAMVEMWKKLGTPGEPHKLFASLAGSWTTQTKEWMEPDKPPAESTGTAEMKHRAIWKIVDNNTQTFDMWGTHEGGKEMKMMEITYTRKP